MEDPRLHPSGSCDDPWPCWLRTGNHGRGMYNNASHPANTSPVVPLPPGLYPAPMIPKVPLPPGFVPPKDPVMMPKVNLAEVVLGLEVKHNYIVKNNVGQQVFAVAEKECCTLQFWDNLGEEVMTLMRPLRCDCCCFPCCLQELEVQSPPGSPIGYVVQEWHPYLPKPTVQIKRREPQLKIHGPYVVCHCCSDVNFDVKFLDETVVVGQISKQWVGFLREVFTDADNFGISFPMDLDVKVKAVLLGCVILIMSFKYSL
uniref:Phospholipid scramblase n=1 Tax=Salmo trutta TaxID=8032 RepID=A0A674CJJ9_SALTR